MRLMRWTAMLAVCAATGCISDEGPTGPMEPEPPPPEVIINLLSEFSNCMTEENWQAASMGDWADKLVEGGTVCSSCHGQGLSRFDTNDDPIQMFQRNRLEVFIQGFFTYNPEGTAVIPNTAKLDIKGNGSGPHPTYSIGQADLDYQKVTTFVQLTNDRLAAGQCGEGGFPNPDDVPGGDGEE